MSQLTNDEPMEQHSYHDIIERVPHEAGFGDHGRRDERAQYSAQSIKAMEKAQDFVCICKVSDMGIPASIE
jgi:hypothetical protein